MAHADSTDREAKPVALLTGASSGIGRASAIRLLRGGRWRVILVARREEELRETVRLAAAEADAAPADAVLRPLDLLQPGAAAELAAWIEQEFGRLDALVNNAGVGSAVPFEHPDAVVDAERMIALNMRAPIALTHACLELLTASRGVIVNVSSVAGMIGTPASPVYSATKFALTGLSEALRARLRSRGIRVVCIQPGPVPTPGWAHERLRASRARRLLLCEADVIAAAVARAVEGRGGVAPVRPRAYSLAPVLRALAPWALRGMLARAAHADPASTSSALLPEG